MRTRILKKRYDRCIDKAGARDLWEDADEFARDLDSRGVDLALAAIPCDLAQFLDDSPWEAIEMRENPMFLVLRDRLLPVFLDHLRAAEVSP
jgi:hypothetical protein